MSGGWNKGEVASNRIEMAGLQFGRLTVLGATDKYTAGAVRWRCACSCGQECTISGPSLRQGKTKSCGCLQEESRRRMRADRSGESFGCWEVLDFSHRKSHQQFWVCVCQCGTLSILSQGQLDCQGKCRSCERKDRRKWPGDSQEARDTARYAAALPKMIAIFRERYRVDPDFRAQRAAEAKRYRARWTPEHRASLLARQRAARERLEDFVVRGILTAKSELRARDIPDDMVTIKREQIRLQRLAREFEQAIDERKEIT